VVLVVTLAAIALMAAWASGLL